MACNVPDFGVRATGLSQRDWLFGGLCEWLISIAAQLSQNLRLRCMRDRV